MRKNDALTYFKAVPKLHNCAQSVAAGAGREDLVTELAACGGGRAPEGLCGALYAALAIVPEAKRADVRRRFEEAVGNVACRDIKAVNKTPCLDCVATAIALARELKD